MGGDAFRTGTDVLKYYKICCRVLKIFPRSTKDALNSYKRCSAKWVDMAAKASEPVALVRFFDTQLMVMTISVTHWGFACG